MLLEHMESNIDFAAGRLKASEGIISHHQEWRELAIRLNEKGVRKTSRKWARCWIDWKCFVRKKYSKITAYNLTPEGEPPNVKISELEQRLIDLLNKIDEMAASGNLTLTHTDPLFEEDIIMPKLETELPNVKMEIDDDNFDHNVNVQTQNGTNSNIKKKSNHKKVCTEQLEVLLRHMEGDLEFASGKSRLSRGKLNYDRQWRQLAFQLNSLGVKKTPNKWARCWIDWKNFVKNKYSKTMSNKGNRRIGRKLSSLEERLVNLIQLISSTRRNEDLDLDPFIQSCAKIEKYISDGFKSKEPEAPSWLEDSEHTEQVNNTSKIDKIFPNCKKVSSFQLRILLESMEQSPSFVNGCARAVKGSQDYTNWWTSLAIRLNSCGVKKTPRKWTRCWIDWKNATKKKYSRVFPGIESGRGSLSSLEKRLLNLMGEASFTQEQIAKTAALEKDISKPRDKIGADSSEEESNVVGNESDDLNTRESDEINMNQDEQDVYLKGNAKETVKHKGNKQKKLLLNVSSKQYRLLLEHLEKNPTMDENDDKCTEVYTTLWKDLASKLNACGRSKTRRKWIQCWTEWKNNTREKESTIQRNRNGDYETVTLSSLEKRLLKFITEREKGDDSQCSQASDDSFGSDSDLPITQFISAFNTKLDNLKSTKDGNTLHNVRKKSTVTIENCGWKPTRKQLKLLLQHLERHPDLATGITQGQAIHENKWWRDLAKILNAHGGKKSGRSWMEYWKEWKENTNRKNNLFKHNSNSNKLTDLEEKLLNIIGGTSNQILLPDLAESNKPDYLGNRNPHKENKSPEESSDCVMTVQENDEMRIQEDRNKLYFFMRQKYREARKPTLLRF